MKTNVTAILIIVLCLFSTATAIAQQQTQDVSSNLEVYVITTGADGEETASLASAVKPGDTLEYRLEYTNNLPNGISNLQPVLPVPGGMNYMGETAEPALAAASLDSAGNTFQSLPIRRQDTLESGLTVEQDVPPAEFRQLRWTVSSLASQESVTLVARMQVKQPDAL